MTFNKNVFFILLLLFPVIAESQMVENKSFDLMLKSLLSHSVKEVSVKEIKSDTLVAFLDSREKNEYEISHIKDAVWCGYNDFTLDRVKFIPKNTKIVVYCSVGYRSEKIAEKLVKAGYTNVFNLVGGIFEWKNQNNTVVDNSGKETQKVFAFNKIWGVWLTRGEKVY